MTPEQKEKLVLFHMGCGRENITQLRGWIHQLIIVSAGIIGFTLPIFGGNQLIKTPGLLIIALFLFWIIISYGLWYIKSVLSRENRELAKQTRELIEKGKMQKSLRKESKKEDYNLDILFFIFVVATLLIILSMVDVCAICCGAF